MKVSNSGAVPSLTVGGRVFTDLANLIVLAIQGGGANATMRVPGGTAGYQVPVGKTLRIWAAKSYTVTGSQNSFPSIGYGDTDVGLASASAPTNAVIGPAFAPSGAGAAGSVTPGEGPLDFAVPAQKYPFLSGGNATVVWAYGYLE